MMGGRGERQTFIFYTQKNPNSRICLPQKIPHKHETALILVMDSWYLLLLVLADERYNSQNYHPWKWFQPIIRQIAVVIFHEIATVSWFQTKSQTVWFLSWKSTTKIRSASACNQCIASQKTKRGENEATHVFLTKFPPKLVSWRSGGLPSAGNLCARTFTEQRSLF